MWFWISVILIILAIIARRAWNSNRGQLLMKGIAMMSKLMTAQKAMTDTCIIHGSYAEISYTYEGRPYKLFVPFHRRKVPKCLGMWLALETDEKSIDITHQPGIPYFCSPSTFGPNCKVILTNDENDKIELTGDTIITI